MLIEIDAFVSVSWIEPRMLLSQEQVSIFTKNLLFSRDESWKRAPECGEGDECMLKWAFNRAWNNVGEKESNKAIFSIPSRDKLKIFNFFPYPAISLRTHIADRYLREKLNATTTTSATSSAHAAIIMMMISHVLKIRLHEAAFEPLLRNRIIILIFVSFVRSKAISFSFMRTGTFQLSKTKKPTKIW